ncbi:MAG: hypothetical protein BMS9Abin12_0637 [Acidimicrobiia bacterium]|nr:MAG: hypothetical protein BMS9Abin12_0637 [Acidimicrobiia bacterium]
MSGRRLKGFVTALYETDPERNLLPLDGLSGDMASFDSATLESLRWASTHYVTPLSVILKRTVPPNVPKPDLTGQRVPTRGPSRADGRHTLEYRVGTAPYGEAIAVSIGPTVDIGRNVVVIAPSVVEIDEIAHRLHAEFGDQVVKATSSMPGAEVTGAWSSVAGDKGTILVGTREVMFWPFGGAGIVVVVEDGRRVMRSQATPTLSVREVVLRRAAGESFSVVFHGPVPTLETIAHGVPVTASQGRQWPMVEVADRSDEPPGGGLLTEKAAAAIRRTTSERERTFVLVSSRGYAPAFRCVACGEVRKCTTCGSAASREDSCRRCGAGLGACSSCGAGRFQALGAGIGRTVETIKAFVGDDVGRADEGRLVTVGSERDLIGVHDMGLAVAVDVDGLTMAPHYRAGEDALRLLARLAHTVKRGVGRSCLIQTAIPRQDVVAALVNGHSEDFLEGELASRRELGFPPVGSLIAIETEGRFGAEELLRREVGQMGTILGPAPVDARMRWLIQGQDLQDARLALRPVLSTLRSRGAKVRVDVDPIDL